MHLITIYLSCILITIITKSLLPILTSAFNYVQYYSWAYLYSNLIIFTACPLTLIVLNPLDLESISEDIPASSQPSYATWLTEWETHLMDTPLVPRVPESARFVHTPLIPTAWGEFLSSYPDQRLVQFFLRGITEGFQVGYSDRISQGLRSSKKNLEGQYNTQMW